MTEDLNIRDSNQDLNSYYYFVYTKNLLIITNSLGLELFYLLNPGLIKYTDNLCDFNLVLDLVFLLFNNIEFGQYTFHPEIQKLLDHVLFILK